MPNTFTATQEAHLLGACLKVLACTLAVYKDTCSLNDQVHVLQAKESNKSPYASNAALWCAVSMFYQKMIVRHSKTAPERQSTQNPACMALSSNGISSSHNGIWIDMLLCGAVRVQLPVTGCSPCQPMGAW